mmetsp:Transcript_29746/g.66762  ORF Transcript_29746/g.66762 Transcript_29746/m.66762 type:complete len:347 (-) Transcript_29746:107-1147(-)
MNVIAPALILLGLALATSDTVASSSATRLGHSQHFATEVSPPAELITPLRSLKKEEKKKKRTKGNAHGRVSSNVDSTVEDDNETEIPRLPAIPYSPRFVIPESMDFGDDWNHGSTAVSAPKSGVIEFNVPDQARVGDTVFLFLSRTDGVLPLRLDKWTRAAECFKSTNRQKKCLRAVHCIERNGPYCQAFKRDNIGGSGKDLGTVVFYRHLKAEDPGCWKIELPGKTTTWLTAISVSGVNKDKPIKRASGVSCDEEWESVFPNVYGEEGDVLLLSQCFDDQAAKSAFLPPQGTDLLGFTNASDEAGFLFGKRLDVSGNTGSKTTRGSGGPKCKDALLSVVVNRNRN